MESIETLMRMRYYYLMNVGTNIMHKQFAKINFGLLDNIQEWINLL